MRFTCPAAIIADEIPSSGNLFALRMSFTFAIVSRASFMLSSEVADFGSFRLFGSVPTPPSRYFSSNQLSGSVRYFTAVVAPSSWKNPSEPSFAFS